MHGTGPLGMPLKPLTTTPATPTGVTGITGVTDVAVGVILRPDGQVLLGDRPVGKPWSGWWELPGGKLEPGETVLEALKRELQEELGITVTRATPWVTYVHVYPTTTVRLHFCRVTDWQSEPQPLEEQQLKWVRPEQALQLPDLLPATYPPLRWLQLPERYLISHAQSPAQWPLFLARLKSALTDGLRLVQWREPGWQGEPSELEAAFETTRLLCRSLNATLLVNSCHPAEWWQRADGVHFRSADARALDARPETLKDKWLAVSAHDATDLNMARELQADFAVLGPVLPTASHPGEATMGWDSFEGLNQEAGLPVYALGGQSPQTLSRALAAGAHGIAGIRQLLG